MRPCIIFNFYSFKNVIRFINLVQAGVYHAYIREKRIKINIMTMKGGVVLGLRIFMLN